MSGLSGFGRRFCLSAVIVVYWCCALWLLFGASPISFDGAGPSATFYWGNHDPTPTLREYDNNIGIRLQFLFPYLCAASIITFAGCVVTPGLLRLRRPRRSYIVLAASAATLLSLLMVGAVSDIGIALHLWRSATMYRGLSYAWPFLKVMVPMSLLAGVLARARDLLGPRD